jgi:predicted RNA binding protein YcfA (HicA-like mRNA interferase family)
MGTAHTAIGGHTIATSSKEPILLHKLSPVSRRELIRKLRGLGAVGPFQGKRHQYMVRGIDTIIIPNPHHGDEIGVDLLSKILRDGGISREEWFSAD